MAFQVNGIPNESIKAGMHLLYLLSMKEVSEVREGESWK
jgi:hypothetical protein